MAVIYTWIINTLDTATTENGLNDVVKVVHWRLAAQDENIIVDSYSTIELDSPDPLKFTPFNELTKTEVITWIESKLDVESIKAGLLSKIDKIKNPPIVARQSPWL